MIKDLLEISVSLSEVYFCLNCIRAEFSFFIMTFASSISIVIFTCEAIFCFLEFCQDENESPLGTLKSCAYLLK